MLPCHGNRKVTKTLVKTSKEMWEDLSPAGRKDSYLDS